MREVAPENLVDRKAEKDVFRELLRFEDDARLLAISDRQGTGKTSLLKILSYICEWEAGVPVAFVPLDAQQGEAITSPFEFISRVRSDLKDLSFTRYDFLNQFRVTHQWVPFMTQPVQAIELYLEDQLARSRPGTVIEGSVDLRDANLEGGVAAGIYIKNLKLEPQRDWTSPDQERMAQQRCIEAFLEDLRTECTDTTIVVLVDSYEQRSPALRDWILKDFIKPCCFDDGRPNRLVVAIAGRDSDMPGFEQILQDRYVELVRSRSQLGWEQEHVRAFLEVHGYERLAEEDIDFVATKVAKGWSISDALLLADTLAARSA
jgi:hypothetical protein